MNYNYFIYLYSIQPHIIKTANNQQKMYKQTASNNATNYMLPGNRFPSGICFHVGSCRNKRCNFNHPRLCNYDGNCVNNNCTYFHKNQERPLIRNIQNNSLTETGKNEIAIKKSFSQVIDKNNDDYNIIRFNGIINELVNVAKRDNTIIELLTMFVIRHPQLFEIYNHPDIKEYCSKNIDELRKFESKMLIDVLKPYIPKETNNDIFFNFHDIHDLYLEIPYMLSSINKMLGVIPNFFAKDHRERNFFEILGYIQEENFMAGRDILGFVINYFNEHFVEFYKKYIHNLKDDPEYTFLISMFLEKACQQALHEISMMAPNVVENLTTNNFPFINFIESLAKNKAKKSYLAKCSNFEMNMTEIIDTIIAKIINGYDAYNDICFNSLVCSIENREAMMEIKKRNFMLAVDFLKQRIMTHFPLVKITSKSTIPMKLEPAINGVKENSISSKQLNWGDCVTTEEEIDYDSWFDACFTM